MLTLSLSSPDWRHPGGRRSPSARLLPLDPAESGLWPARRVYLPSLLLPGALQLLTARPDDLQPVDEAAIRNF